jgi:hypothetical protein
MMDPVMKVIAKSSMASELKNSLSTNAATINSNKSSNASMQNKNNSNKSSNASMQNVQSAAPWVGKTVGPIQMTMSVKHNKLVLGQILDWMTIVCSGVKGSFFWLLNLKLIKYNLSTKPDTL